MTYCKLITHTLEIILVRSNPPPFELEIKDTTESNTFASYLDLFPSIGRDDQLCTSLYDKRDDLNFQIKYFPFLSSNIHFHPPVAFLFQN